MKMKSRVSILAVALPMCILLGGFSIAQAKEELWSNPATWPDKKVPAAGDKVDIASGKDVVLDVSPPALDGITINGKLSFSDKADLELTTEWIMVHGELQIGTEAKPYTHKATITLTDNVKGEQMMGMGDRGIMLSGGTLNLHGNRTNTWTKLAKTADAGSTSIEVLNAAQWKAGDEIVLASTDFNPRQAERRTIAAIKGNAITLDKPLEYMHFGKITFDVDERGEVGLLTRNIKVQASEDAAQTFFGGHIMAMVTSKMYVEGVELNRMGQNLELARYPIHWHLVGDAKGQYIKNAAIHDTYNRCVTVHGTNFLHVENNVTYNTVGHCFFMEDGIEHGNEFIHNLAIQTKCHTSKACVPTNLAAAGENPNYGDRAAVRQNGQQSKDVLLPSDNTASSYWITNPDNTYRDNVAAGSDANGFWMSLNEHPNGAFQDSDASKATWPRRTPFKEFKGNVAHSNYDSFMFDRNLNPNNTFGVTGPSHTGLENPADPNSKPVIAVFEDLTGYKNRNGAIWGRGEMHMFKNVKLADNAIGFTHASGAFGRYEFTSRVVDSLFVGETENIGNPSTDAEKAYGRSLPKPMLPDFPIRGYEYYDYRHDIINTTFENFEDNATRKTGAISNLLFSSFGVSTNNGFEHLKFVNAKPVYFPPMAGNAKWASDNGGSTSYKTAAYRDKDGSLGMGPNSFVIINDGPNDSIATDVEACQIKPDWNAAVCKGDVGRLSFAAPGGGFGARPPGGGAGGPGAAAGPGPAVAGGPGAAPAAAGAPGGAPRPAGAGGPGGGFGGGAPAQPPVVLSRNGKEYTITGATNVRAGTTIKVATERPTLNLNLTELDKGSWVIFELQGFSTAASGTEQSSMDALRKATDTAYFKTKDTLWVKVVSAGDPGTGAPGGGTNVQVSR
ncbi:MAG TPA: G8 domain-containing protein [Candidatus Acidoferrum sp.]|nr:G8 domain-containing protein [Candidatus Acidoferrum sp.]